MWLPVHLSWEFPEDRKIGVSEETEVGRGQWPQSKEVWTWMRPAHPQSRVRTSLGAGWDSRVR